VVSVSLYPRLLRWSPAGSRQAALPLADAVVLGSMRMNRFLEVDYDNRLAVVEAGVTNLLNLLEKEMRVAMTLTSVKNVSEITGDLLVRD